MACDANPVRCIAANRKSPDRSPVNIRPVRLAPCAAGARPTTSTDASGSPKPGTGRAQYVSSRNAARFSTPTSSRHATSRGHARHCGTTASSAARSAAPAAARTTSSGVVGTRPSRAASSAERLRPHPAPYVRRPRPRGARSGPSRSRRAVRSPSRAPCRSPGGVPVPRKPNAVDRPVARAPVPAPCSRTVSTLAGRRDAGRPQLRERPARGSVIVVLHRLIAVRGGDLDRGLVAAGPRAADRELRRARLAAGRSASASAWASGWASAVGVGVGVASGWVSVSARRPGGAP